MGDCIGSCNECINYDVNRAHRRYPQSSFCALSQRSRAAAGPDHPNNFADRRWAPDHSSGKESHWSSRPLCHCYCDGVSFFAAAPLTGRTRSVCRVAATSRRSVDVLDSRSSVVHGPLCRRVVTTRGLRLDPHAPRHEPLDSSYRTVALDCAPFGFRDASHARRLVGIEAVLLLNGFVLDGPDLRSSPSVRIRRSVRYSLHSTVLFPGCVPGERVRQSALLIMFVLIYKAFLSGLLVILYLYAIREYIFSFVRLSRSNPHDPFETVGHFMPSVSVLVPMHNEERVAADVLKALAESDYAKDRLQIIAINDRSTDRTGQIINQYASQYPAIQPVHRTSGGGYKAAALEYGAQYAVGDILVFFDADYIPGKSLVKFLVSPFSDLQVGAVMGRVVPVNSAASILAALISQERAAGYQIQQEARSLLGLVPQFGGTAGALRASALRSAGGWNLASLTEDTDITCRLILKGWKIAYLNRAECYEEVPRLWRVRRLQLRRWVLGHTECFHQYFVPIVRCKHLTPLQRLDTLLMLGQYWTAPIMATAWLWSLVLFCCPMFQVPLLFYGSLFLFGLQTFGNQASFVQIGSAAILDGSAGRVLLMPLQIVNYFSSTLLITKTLWQFYLGKLSHKSRFQWDKTARSRGLEQISTLR